MKMMFSAMLRKVESTPTTLGIHFMISFTGNTDIIQSAKEVNIFPCRRNHHHPYARYNRRKPWQPPRSPLPVATKIHPKPKQTSHWIPLGARRLPSSQNV